MIESPGSPSAIRCRCGADQAAGAHFCSACGAALVEPSVLLGAAPATVIDEARLPGIDRRWLAVAAVAVAALVGWSFWSSGASGDGQTPDGLARATPTTSDVPAATTAPTTIDRGPPTTVRDPALVRQVGSGQPLLGEVTGLRAIFVQQPSELSVLDLDTGQLLADPTLYSWIEPFMVSGDWLVARVDDSLAAFALGDLGARPIPLLPDETADAYGRSVVFPEPRADGTAWVVVYTDGEPVVFHQVDLASGQPLDAFVWPVGTLSNNWVRHDVDDDEAVFSTTDGGVYLATGDTFRRVADGRLVAGDDRRALVETCDERLRCQIGWLDRSTWLPIDLPLPGLDFDGAAFVGGTDWLLLADFTGGSEDQSLFNVTTGRRRPLDPNDHLNFEASAPPISPDGRWMALHDGVNLVIVDLTNDVRHVIEGVEGLSGAMVLTTAEVGIGPTR